MSARRLTLVTLAWLCALALWGACGAQAAYLHSYTGVSFGPTGPGSKFSAVGNVAVDPTTHDVYAIDAGTSSVYRFDASGKPANFSRLGATNVLTGKAAVGCVGTGAECGETPQNGFFFATPAGSQVAIDASSGPDKGDIYVTDLLHGVVDVFAASGAYVGQLSGTSAGSFASPCGVAVDQAGDVFVSEVFGADVVKFAPKPAPAVAEWEQVATLTSPASCGLAVDSSGQLYVASASPGLGGLGALRKYDASLQSLGEVGTPPPAWALATDPSTGEVYVDHNREAGGTPHPTELTTFNQAGEPAGPMFAPHEAGESEGVAVDGASGSVYVSNTTNQEVDVFNSLALPDVITGEASTVSETTALVKGSMNPNGVAVTECKVEYGTTTAYGSSAPCSSSPGAGSAPVPVTATLTGLAARSEYHYRLAASNANGSWHGQDHTYLAPEHVTVSEQWTTDVADTGVRLWAKISPGGASTAYRFEYGTTTAYGRSIPVPDGEAGSTLGQTTLSAGPEGLSAGALYHYRISATNVLGEVHGEDRTFTTQTTPGGSLLLDNRAWEQVSPAEKGSAQITSELDLIDQQASEDGSKVTYTATAPIAIVENGVRIEPPSNSDQSQIFSTRVVGGWSSRDIATPHNEETGSHLGVGQEYQVFSSDLSFGLVNPLGATPLAPEVLLPSGEGQNKTTLYLRNDESGAFQPLVTKQDGEAGGAKLGTAAFVAASPDLQHIVFNSPEPLTSGCGSAPCGFYEWTRMSGQLQLVGVLPDGERVSPSGIGGKNGFITRHAVSGDGSRIAWTLSSASGQTLYLQDMNRDESVQIDASQGGVQSGGGEYETASSDTRKVFFLSRAKLTADSTAPGTELGMEGSGGDLYIFELTSGAGEKPAGRLTDLTVDEHAGEHACVTGLVIGASEDGSYVYFVASGALAPGASVGANNLYVEHYDGTAWHRTFIAALSSEDFPDWRDQSLGGRITSRVSPNGRFLSFMSKERLTGYDNADANSGRPDEEVFEYDASANRLVCVSCNRTGARPVGVHDTGDGAGLLLVDRALTWHTQSQESTVLDSWLAANVPAWESSDITGYRAPYQPRFLSDSGRLFFNSPDALVPQDTNGTWDVYEWEPYGVGSCVLTRGCVGLVSSGTGNSESVFIDASASGDDVFFETASSLVARDRDTAFDMYDAHVCSASAPCLTEPVSPPPCGSGDSCKAAPMSQPELFGAPPSATFSGVGNLTSRPAATGTPVTKAKPRACKSGYVRRKGRCVRKPRARKAARRRGGR